MAIIVGSFGMVTLRFVVRRAEGSAVDFNDATSASIDVRWPKLTPAPDEARVIRTWTPTLEVQSESLAYLFYPLAEGDLPRVGLYGVAVELSSPSGPIPCEPGTLPVIDRF